MLLQMLSACHSIGASNQFDSPMLVRDRIMTHLMKQLLSKSSREARRAKAARDSTTLNLNLILPPASCSRWRRQLSHCHLRLLWRKPLFLLCQSRIQRDGRLAQATGSVACLLWNMSMVQGVLTGGLLNHPALNNPQSSYERVFVLQKMS